MNAPRPPLKPLDEALAELLQCATLLDGVEAVSTFDADGRVLAQDLVSALQVPPQDNSSMDGYAVRCADVATAGVVLPESQRIAAGMDGARDGGECSGLFRQRDGLRPLCADDLVHAFQEFDGF